MGGEGDPCINRAYIPKWEKATGRPCPRVELWEVNRETATLAFQFVDVLLAGEGPYGNLMGSIVSGTMAARAVHEGAEATSALAARALKAINDETVSALLVAKIETRQKKQEEEQRKKLERGKGKAGR